VWWLNLGSVMLQMRHCMTATMWMRPDQDSTSCARIRIRLHELLLLLLFCTADAANVLRMSVRTVLLTCGALLASNGHPNLSCRELCFRSSAYVLTL
jgi:hypothetical protein